MFQVISYKEKDKWNEIIEKSKNADIYQQWGYVESNRLNGDGEPLLFTYITDDTEIINVVLKRDIALDKNFSNLQPNKYFDLISPYGYGGTLIESTKSDEVKEYFEKYNKYCRKKKIISEFVRFNPLMNSIELLENEYEVIPLGETITMNLESTDVIWSNMQTQHRSKVRQTIRKGVEVFVTNDISILPEFIKIYEETMDKNRADDYYYFKYDYYENYFKSLKNNFLVFYAKYEEKIISASIILMGNKILHYHLSGTLSEYRNLVPNNVILTQAALWGLSNGYKIFHLGGGLGSKEDSLYLYKRKFNQVGQKQFYIGKKIFDKSVYNELVNESRNEKSPVFFPLYRA